MTDISPTQDPLLQAHPHAIRSVLVAILGLLVVLAIVLGVLSLTTWLRGPSALAQLSDEQKLLALDALDSSSTLSVKERATALEAVSAQSTTTMSDGAKQSALEVLSH